MAAEEYYTQAPVVRFMHQLPRFGHGSDFSKLASSDREEQTDYVVGIFAVSFFVLSLFVFWGAAVVACKCMGSRRVGACAGMARVVSDDKGRFRPPHRLRMLRCSFAALGCGMILLCAALVGPGLRSVEATSASVRKLNRDVRDLITQGLLIMDSVKRVRWTFDALDVDSVLRVEGACPNSEGGAFASDKKIRRSIGRLNGEFDDLRGYLEGSDFEGMRRRVDLVLDGSDRVDAAVTVVEMNDWIVRMFALVTSAMVAFMIFATCASSGRMCPCRHLPALRWMAEFFVLPAFVVLVVVAWFAASALAIASVSNADFCAGNSRQSGPAGTVMGAFAERGIASDDAAFAAFSYYQSGCATEDPIERLYRYEDGIQGGIGSANVFLTRAEEIGMDEIAERCGADVRPIIEGIGLIKDNLGILLGALRSTFELASCVKMSPVYRRAFEGTICTESSASLTLMFLITFGINVVGMLMITLRSAMYPYEKVHAASSKDDDEDEWAEYQAYLRHMASFVSMWGGAADEDGASSKTGTNETSDSTESIVNTRDSFLSDEETPRAPYTPAHGAFQMDGIYEDEELMPLSPQTPDLSGPRTKRLADSGRDEEDFDGVEYAVSRVGDAEPSGSPRRRRRPQPHRGGEMNYGSPEEDRVRSSSSSPAWASAVDDGADDDEFTPLSPATPSVHSGGRPSGHSADYASPRTPGVRSSGGRTGGRPSGRAAGVAGPEPPDTPLMTSPHGPHEGGNYFGNLISPLRRDGPGEGGGSVKRE